MSGILSSGILSSSDRFPRNISIQTTNTDFINYGGAGSALLIENSSPTGQNIIASTIEGSLRAKWRSDRNGNIHYTAHGGYHVFYSGSDSSSDGDPTFFIYRSGNVSFGIRGAFTDDNINAVQVTGGLLSDCYRTRLDNTLTLYTGGTYTAQGGDDGYRISFTHSDPATSQIYSIPAFKLRPGFSVVLFWDNGKQPLINFAPGHTVKCAAGTGTLFAIAEKYTSVVLLHEGDNVWVVEGNAILA